VTVEARLLEPAPRPLTLALTFGDTSVRPVRQPVAQGARTVRFTVPVPNARLWRLEDPYLYEATATLGAPGLAEDRVETYFGMRSVSVARLPGTDIPYVALNGRPVYMQLALDQAYHPTGYYTFPTDSVLRDEILRARQIGLNGLREHIKIEAPRKLYWADRLGVLIMADVPNWWGPPDSAAFREHEVAMRGMIERDYNHPSIFSWVAFNETWGLRTRQPDRSEAYLPATQARVSAVQRLAKRLDPTRLVEDNSVCCGAGHTTTDLNTWHEYLAGWQWPAHVAASPTAPSSARPGTSSAATGRPGSRCSTRSSATCGATRAARATSTTAGTTTRRWTSSAARRSWRDGSTPSITTSSTSGTGTGASTARTRRPGSATSRPG
jgi:beta-galactosidase/beta-glucuronidase